MRFAYRLKIRATVSVRMRRRACSSPSGEQTSRGPGAEPVSGSLSLEGWSKRRVAESGPRLEAVAAHVSRSHCRLTLSGGPSQRDETLGRMRERALTRRELNRATLARQLLLERKRLSATAVIERLVGMQAQWPSAPYVGIWTRATSFRRGTLERELATGSVLKANLMRQTLHLVTRRDYGLLRAAISESGHPDQWPNSIKVAPSVRALAERKPVTLAEGLELLEREHGLTGITARRA